MSGSTKDQVQRLLDEGLNVRQIAARLEISTQAVYKHLKTLGIPAPSRRSAS